MKWFLIPAFVTLLGLAYGCERSHKKSETEVTDEGPKTTYGKAVGSAKDLSSDSDERNDDIQKQADALFSD